MYRLSDEDTDSSSTIYYKAYNEAKPEVNESNAESTQRTQDMEQEIKRRKAERSKKRKRKKPTSGHVPQPTDKDEDSYEDPDAAMANRNPARGDPPLPRTYPEFEANASTYSGHPAWVLCSPRTFYLWT
jgi:hypothetical protein